MCGMIGSTLRRPVGALRPLALSALVIVLTGCGGGGGHKQGLAEQTMDATVSNPSNTNANTSPLNLTLTSGGQNGTVTISGAFLIVNGVGSMTLIGSDGASPARKITINTSGTPSAGTVYQTSAAAPNGNNTFAYTEGSEKWGGTGTITINSVSMSPGEVSITAHMNMQPDPASPAGATGTFTMDVTGSMNVFGL